METRAYVPGKLAGRGVVYNTGRLIQKLSRLRKGLEKAAEKVDTLAEELDGLELHLREQQENGMNIYASRTPCSNTRRINTRTEIDNTLVRGGLSTWIVHQSNKKDYTLEYSINGTSREIPLTPKLGVLASILGSEEGKKDGEFVPFKNFDYISAKLKERFPDNEFTIHTISQLVHRLKGELEKEGLPRDLIELNTKERAYQLRLRREPDIPKPPQEAQPDYQI